MRSRVPGHAGTNLTIVPDLSSFAVGWMANGKACSLVRQISVREFGHSHVDKVLVSDIFHSSQPSARFSTIENLKPGVCFMTIYGDVKQSQADLDIDDGDCREIVTLVSTSTTTVVVALVCCFFFFMQEKVLRNPKV